MVPEGGSGELGVTGCEDILMSAGNNALDYDEIWLPSGTGATGAGVIRSVPLDTALVRCVAVLKGAEWLVNDIRQYLPQATCQWQVETAFYCGGYAKIHEELLSFMQAFKDETNVSLDHVYTGKMLFALKQQTCLQPGCRILALHTGGLQGLRGLQSIE